MFGHSRQHLLVNSPRRGKLSALLQRYRSFEQIADIGHVILSMTIRKRPAFQPAVECKSSRRSCASTSGLWPLLTYRRNRPCGSKMYVPVE